MRFFSLAALLSLSTRSLATYLYVSSYTGTITTLSLQQNTDGTFTLAEVAVNTGSMPNPSFLTLDHSKGVVYCVDEGLYVHNGTLSSYKTSANGLLTQISHQTTLGGPVHSAIYNNDSALVLAHYTGSGVSTWLTSSTGDLRHLQTMTFKLTAPGANRSRQDAPHPHEAIRDPLDNYILVPDLGADLIRIFSINKATSMLTEIAPYKAPAGSGPRHGVFLVEGNQTYFYLSSELANTVTAFKVNYAPKGLTLTQIFLSSIYGHGVTHKAAGVAEIAISPNKLNLLTSSRGDGLFSIRPYPPASPSQGNLTSDSLETWQIDPSTGQLTFLQNAPAGGVQPRQFSLNSNGTLAAVGLQSDGRVVISARDECDGLIEGFVAEIAVSQQVTCVIWDE